MPLSGEYAPSTDDWSWTQVERYERTRGAEDNTYLDRPIVPMTCRGVASGALRKVLVMRVEHGGEYAAVASHEGRPRHPAWYHNLTAHPEVTLQDGAVARDYRAREVTGEERTVWWARAVAAYPPYADYQARTTREIPVFVLSPVAPHQPGENRDGDCLNHEGLADAHRTPRTE